MIIGGDCVGPPTANVLFLLQCTASTGGFTADFRNWVGSALHSIAWKNVQNIRCCSCWCLCRNISNLWMLKNTLRHYLQTCDSSKFPVPLLLQISASPLALSSARQSIIYTILHAVSYCVRSGGCGAWTKLYLAIRNWIEWF